MLTNIINSLINKKIIIAYAKGEAVKLIHKIEKFGPSSFNFKKNPNFIG